MRTIRRLLTMVMVLLLCAGSALALSSRSGVVRVRLSSLSQSGQLTITVHGQYHFSSGDLPALQDGARVTVRLSGGKLQINTGSRTVTLSSVRLIRDSGDGLSIAQSQHPEALMPGDLSLSVIRQEDTNAILPVLSINMEDYLVGVLPWEMGASAPTEALKAQAIAARSYALSRMAAHSRDAWDVTDTTMDQVYGGTPAQSTRCAAAVRDTQGVVLTWQGQVAEALYTASNGGQTESAANVWGSAGFDYLPVQDDPYDIANPDALSPSVLWPTDLTQADQTLQSLLRGKLAQLIGEDTDYTLYRLEDVRLTTPRYAQPSRLYTRLEADVSILMDGMSFPMTLTFDLFGELEGPLGLSVSLLQNELWTVTRMETGYLLTARRFGHGIGMSQRGAMLRADTDMDCREILSFYYPGCSLQQVTLTTGSGASLPPAELPTRQTGPAVVVTGGGNLNLRGRPSSDSDPLTSIPNGTRVQVSSRSGDWAAVTWNGISGYVVASYLRMKAENVPTAVGYATVLTDASGLNLRQEPSWTAAVPAVIPQYTVIPVFSDTDGWIRTFYRGSWGYVRWEYLSLSGNEPPSITPTPGPTVTGYVTPSPTPGPTATPQPGQSGPVIRSGMGGAPMRVLPDASAPIMLTIPDGSSITVEEQDGDWCCVTWQEATGYVETRYITWASAATPVPTATPAPASGKKAVVAPSDGRLNLRSGPSTDSEILLQLESGTELILLQDDGTWCQVQVNGVTGWCMRAYLTIEEQFATRRGWVQPDLAGGLNLRKEPDLNAEVLTVLAAGAALTVEGSTGDWLQISCGSWHGYALARYVTYDQPGGTQVTTVTRYANTSGSLNLRARPDPDSQVLTKIPRGGAVIVLMDQGDWSYVSYQQTRGYVKTMLLSDTPPDGDTGTGLFDSTLRQVWGQSATVKTGGAALRMWCRQDAPMIRTVPAGTRVEVQEVGDTWCKINDGENEGYCLKTALSMN